MRHPKGRLEVQTGCGKEETGSSIRLTTREDLVTNLSSKLVHWAPNFKFSPLLFHIQVEVLWPSHMTQVNMQKFGEPLIFTIVLQNFQDAFQNLNPMN